MFARDINRRRMNLDLSQAVPARRAGIRPETLNRLEKALDAPNATTTAKIEAVVEGLEA